MSTRERLSENGRRTKNRSENAVEREVKEKMMTGWQELKSESKRRVGS